jgi:hypothetical protein
MMIDFMCLGACQPDLPQWGERKHTVDRGIDAVLKERDERQDHDGVQRLDLRREPCDAEEVEVHVLGLQHPFPATLVPQ